MWEYTVFEYHYSRNNELHFRDQLNGFGKVGWELVSTQQREPYSKVEKYDIVIVCLFKRKCE
jgi:hypothetical protein